MFSSKKNLLAFILVSSPCWSGTFANIQHVCNTACPSSGSTCSVTVSSTGAGHILLATSLRDTSGDVKTITGVSGGGTWTHCPNCNGVDATAGSVDASYTLNSSSGATSITLTLSAAVSNGWAACVQEWSFTASGVAFDISGNRAQTTAVANASGVALALSGGNELISQFGVDAGSCSGISAPYSDATFPNNNCLADSLNTSSGTAPTWTSTSGRGAFGAIVFKETGGAVKTCTLALTGVGPC